MRVAHDGQLWVERRGAGWEDPGLIDVLRPSGPYVGTLAAGEPGLPGAMGPSGLPAYVETDRFDTAVVRVVGLVLMGN